MWIAYLLHARFLHVLTWTPHGCCSTVLVLIQSRNVLTRPYCLIELLTAIQYNIPIVGLCLVGVAAQYARACVRACVRACMLLVDAATQYALERVHTHKAACSYMQQVRFPKCGAPPMNSRTHARTHATTRVRTRQHERRTRTHVRQYARTARTAVRMAAHMHTWQHSRTFARQHA